MIDVLTVADNAKANSGGQLHIWSKTLIGPVKVTECVNVEARVFIFGRWYYKARV